MLGVEPNQRFKVKCDYETYNDYYYIDENLKFQIDKEDYITSLTTLDAIRGDIKIIQIPKYDFTKGENDALKGLKLLKFNYIARNETGKLIAYTDKPEKNYTSSIWQDRFGEITYVNPNMFKSIQWKDSEPFEIPDIENEPEYETDKKKIEEKLIEIYKQIRTTCNNTPCSNCNYYADMNIDCTHKMAINELIKNNFTFLKSEE